MYWTYSGAPTTRASAANRATASIRLRRRAHGTSNEDTVSSRNSPSSAPTQAAAPSNPSSRTSSGYGMRCHAPFSHQ